MSLATDRSSFIRLQKDIGDLRTKEAAEVKKAADAQKKMAVAHPLGWVDDIPKQQIAETKRRHTVLIVKACLGVWAATFHHG